MRQYKYQHACDSFPFIARVCVYVYNTSLPFFVSYQQNVTVDQSTTKPIDISEEEELERITALLKRDNLIRGLGVVEFVYKLLHCTPGTGGLQKNCSLYHGVSIRLAMWCIEDLQNHKYISCRGCLVLILQLMVFLLDQHFYKLE